MVKPQYRNRTNFVLILALVFGSLPHSTWASESESGCPSGIGSEEGQKPSLVIKLDATTIVWICGDGNPEPGQVPLYSEFDLVDGSTRKSFFTVGALDEGTVDAIGGALHFTAYRRYPIGPEFKWVDVPFQEVIIRKVGRQFESNCKQLFFRPRFSQGQLREIRRRYEIGKRSRHLGEDMSELPVLAMLDGEDYFEMSKIAPDLRLDGAYAENFDSVRQDYMEIKNGTCGYRTNASEP